MYGGLSVLLIAPAFNEEQKIGEVVRRITGASSVAGVSGKITAPAVVTIPFTSTRSLTATASPLPPWSETEMKALSSDRSRILARARSRSIPPLCGVKTTGRGVILTR